MELSEDAYLAHYGILRRSGRYPWGSGKTPAQRNKLFLDTVKELRDQGMSDVEIARAFSTDADPFTTTMLVDAHAIAVNQQRWDRIQQAEKLAATGMSNSAIGREMGINESSVRALREPGRIEKAQQLQNTADMLKRQVAEKGLVDIGAQVERSLPMGDMAAEIGLPRQKFDTALALLREEGYAVDTVRIPQLGTKDLTTIKVLGPPGTTQADMWARRHEIKQISERTPDSGTTYELGMKPTIPVSAKRLAINYAEDGGADADGVIYIRPGAKDLDLGASRYAQVRINVDNSHYLKGMAVYKDDLPDGVDLVFNTNKSRKDAPSKHDALKPLKRTPAGDIDVSNPFGAFPKLNGQRGALNILNEEGDWDNWSKNLPSQMLSKQEPRLAKQQLELTFERRRNALNELQALTNPTVKRKLLDSFADEADSAAVHLKAANMPRQATKVLMPVSSVKPTEAYIPSMNNGDKVALVRFPHGGTFEIAELTVNNRNPAARKLLGSSAKDAVGIHAKVAERLSGADFDGDTVLAIPNDRGSVKSTPPLGGLKDFDPKTTYRAYDGMRTVDGGVYNAKARTVEYGGRQPRKASMQQQMGDISNLITDMTIKGANEAELARAVRHSMVVIDSEKHALDYRASARDNGIGALKQKYQGSARAGAGTLLSRAGSPKVVPHFKPRPAKDGGPIDKATGKRVFVPSGKTYVDRRTGETKPSMVRAKKLSLTDDAHTLVSSPSGTPMEHLYADHSNRLKALANEARKDYVNTAPIRSSPSAKKVYRAQVESLDRKLDVALKNAPLERKAQVLANAVVARKKQSNPNMDGDDLKKIKNQALAEMRVRTGAGKKRINLEQDEWNAIQAGALSNKKLSDILNNTDIEKVKVLATPRTKLLMSPTATARAQSMLARGYTQAEVAEQLGVSLTTLKTGIE